MSDIVDPTTNPELAAFQLVVEIIRAEKTPMFSDNASNILKIYDQAVRHFSGKEKQS
ncbi:MAG TPA: ATP-NAD kinase [Klebsiella sp.]|jgi:hypothetical protein